MSIGLLALIDDIAALAKMSAASLDDIAAQSLRTGTKSLGIVIDDAAVTPKFVTGVSPARELPTIWKITRASLFNKLAIIAPAALLLSAFAPGVITPLLMAGGLYLSFEGAEKVLEWLGLHHEEAHEETAPRSPEEVERSTVSSAIRTDFILSTEIMVLTLSGVADEPLTTRIGVLVAIGVAFTLGVYGVVALIVRADDFGLRLAQREPGLLQRFGRRLVRGVGPFLQALGAIGTLAMLWVGGHLLIDGLAEFHLEAPEHIVESIAHAAAAPFAGGFAADAAEWIAGAAASGLAALGTGAVLAAIASFAGKLRRG